MSRRTSTQGETPTGDVVLYPIHEGPQMVFMESEAAEIMYGGAAFGGKSYALRAILVSYCLQYPGATAVLFRRTFRELEDTHIANLLLELPSWLASYKSSSHEFRFTNGSKLMLRFCEKEEDVYSYDTFECDIMAFDELTAFSAFQYNYLITRCRSTKPWWPLAVGGPGRRIRSATNPGNVGHGWVKKRFIDYLEPYQIKKAPKTEGGMMRQFIAAKASDNTTGMITDPDYMDVLRGLPDEEYRAKALGDWSVFSGQFFSRWRDAVHICEPFTIPASWKRYICVDWGIAAPHAVYWLARPPDTNFIWVYREQYGAGWSTREQARSAGEKTRGSGEKIEMVITDPAMYAKERDADGNRMKSPADFWIEEFAGIADVIRGNNERLQGASVFRDTLDWQGVETSDGIEVLVPPRMKVFRTCENFIDTVPGLIHDVGNVEDVDTSGDDHSYDAVRYGLRFIFTPPAVARHPRVMDTPDGLVILDG